MPSECRYKNADQSLLTPSRVLRLQFQSIDSSTALDSLQTSTGTRISLHETATIVGPQSGPESTLKVCKAKNSICGKCGKKGHIDSLCRSSGTPVHMLEAQDHSHPQSQESPQDYNQSPETAQYSTPHLISREELPQAKCNSLKTVQVSRLGANEQSEHI